MIRTSEELLEEQMREGWQLLKYPADPPYLTVTSYYVTGAYEHHEFAALKQINLGAVKCSDPKFNICT